MEFFKKQYEHYWYYFVISGLLLVTPLVIVYVLISNENFPNGEPSAAYDFAEVQSFEPPNGSFSGGTTVTITVSNVPAMFAVGTVAVTVAGRDCADPGLTVSGITVWRVTCTTAVPVSRGGDEPREGPVQIAFALWPVTELTVSSWPREFRFVDDAAVVVGRDGHPSTDRNRTATAAPDFGAQRFRGIASGGTAMPVRGAHLSRAANVTMYVADRVPRSAGCRLVDDTRMVCRSPALGGGRAPWTALRFGFLAVDAGTGRALDWTPQPPDDAVRYLLYPDPVLVDFETDDGRRAVIVNGRDLHRGYGIDDVTVRFRDRAGRCDVTFVDADKIVCRSARPGRLDDLRDIVVSVGDAFERNLTRTTPGHRSKSHRDVVVVAVTGVFLTLCALSLLFAFCFKTDDQFGFTRLDKHQRRSMQHQCINI